VTALAPRDRDRAEILRALRAMNEHLDGCPHCLRGGYGLCPVGLALSGALVRARTTGEARGIPPEGPSGAPPSGILEVAPELELVP
jgi:hypothetical protein